MKKVKVQRSTPTLDMTPMVDLAFLLVTFFMLTTKFTPQESVVVDMPESHSEYKLEDSDVLTVTISKEGNVFFNVDGKFLREQILIMMGNRYGIFFNHDEVQNFSLMSGIGMPIQGLKAFLNMKASKRSEIQQHGIPYGSSNNELSLWIAMTRVASSRHGRTLTYAVKGDRDAQYPVVKRVLDTFMENNIKGFNLVTSLAKD